jgi:hypothetical protein
LTTPEPGFVHAIGTHAVGERVEGEEAEPNDQFALANRIELTQPLTGRIGPADTADYFRFDVDEAIADSVSTLKIESSPAINLSFCLMTADGIAARCRDDTTPFELQDLVLEEGAWGLSVGRTNTETEYSVSLATQGPIEPGIEAEPNDTVAFASGVPPNLRIKGRFSGSDTDFYQFLISDEAQLWRFQVIGDEVVGIGYSNGSNGAGHRTAELRAHPGQRQLRFDDLFLLPGRHYIRVDGRDGGDYTLLARPMGPPNPDGELEPNDASNKQRLAFGQTRIGLLADPGDRDHYRFFLANHDHIRLTVKPPADGSIAPVLTWYGQSLGQARPGTAGDPVSLQGLFPPGDYQIELVPQQSSDAEYTLSLERLPRFSCPTDCEPNGMGELHLAAALPPDLVLEGRTGEWGDLDFYALPVVETPTDVLIRSAEPISGVWLGRNTLARETLQYDTEMGGYRGTLPPNEAYRLMLDSGSNPYRLELEFPDGAIKPVTETLAAELSLDVDTVVVAAYRTHGQRVAGKLVLANTGTAALNARLDVVTSDYRWRVSLGQSELTVPAGGRATVPVEIEVPADAWADRPVRISARARDSYGRQAEAWREIAVARDAAPAETALHFPIVESLRGGFNAAWAPLGGELTVDRTESGAPDLLHDGLAFPGTAFYCCTDADGWSDEERPFWTLDLPGNVPLPVAGVALNHFGSDGAYQNIRLATLLVSEDGINFEEVMSFETLPIKTEQHFALPTAVPARFVRLRIASTFQESQQRVFAAEWKVILEPGYDLSGGEGFDLADPALGGHVVWDSPPEANSPSGILVDEDRAEPAAAVRGETKDYVIGFHQSRAAQITSVEWRYPPAIEDARKSYDRVTVAAALASPVGPWTPLGEMDLGGGQTVATLELPQAAWARYLRLTAHRRADGSDPTEPGLIRVRERPTDADYRSVLTEWGNLGSRGYYEQQAGLPPEPGLTATGNESRATAAPLAIGTLAQGEVTLRAATRQWYRVSVPAGHNTLSVDLTGDPTVRTVVSLENAAGDAVPLRPIDAERLPSRHRFEAVVEPGSNVWLNVTEPPRNVIFSWDTSASVGPYIPMINNSLVAFSGQVVRGQEAVNLMPFSMYPLLREWYGEPYALQTMLNEHRPGNGSSSAEWTLKLAGQELAPRPGTKAIVVITDAETPHDGQMWEIMQAVQPRIFGVGVAGSIMDDQHRLRDWAAINGGHFSQLIYEGEMEVAFDRAATLMHRPADYTLKVGSEFRELPGPGRLSVVAGAGGTTAAGGAVELILDASGSMLQRMDGKRRINIAKEVLTEAVRELIPAGTPVALRVFGHREPDACRTDLEIPLGPLDSDAAATTIEGIQAMNLARTPIADSLAAVEADLGGAQGGAVVVLVTDGEETCDGNPEAVIAALRDKGIAVSLNIVGFAIDDAELAAQFEAWAELGGGRYLAANDPGDLSEALEVALRMPFTVYDQGGNEVAVGEVGGEPVELAQGVYRVVVNTAEPRIFEAVEIQGESELLLEL